MLNTDPVLNGLINNQKIFYLTFFNFSMKKLFYYYFLYRLGYTIEKTWNKKAS